MLALKLLLGAGLLLGCLVCAAHTLLASHVDFVVRNATRERLTACAELARTAKVCSELAPGAATFARIAVTTDTDFQVTYRRGRAEHRARIDSYATHDRRRHAKALRYMRNQSQRLTLFLRDGRVLIHNNLAELGGRHIAVGRHNWTFLGSDAAASAAAIWITLVLSAAMHQVEPERYLRDLFRVLPDWPVQRILELAPHAWLETRSRLDSVQLSAEHGPLNVPPPVGALEPGAT